MHRMLSSVLHHFGNVFCEFMLKTMIVLILSCGEVASWVAGCLGKEGWLSISYGIP